MEVGAADSLIEKLDAVSCMLWMVEVSVHECGKPFEIGIR